MSVVVGLMSGTSLDGVDAVLVDFASGRPITLGSLWHPYPDDIRQRALALQTAEKGELHRSAVLSNDLAACYATAVRELLAKLGQSKEDVSAIGCHGQTVRHQPGLGYSIQLNNPARLVELTGIQVVADFRSRDIAAGGQGAPLVPAFHSAVFANPQQHRVVLNLGGIANVTDLKPGAHVRGFDCGPGNMLLDAWAERHLGQRYDANGEWGSGGTPIRRLLEKLLENEYFYSPPPKSCGRDDFNLDWLEKHLSKGDRPQDVQASLLELTAITVSEAIRRWCGQPELILACGGGVHNAALMGRLRQLAPASRIDLTDALGQPTDWVEAVAFAWLAWRALHHEPANLPEVTGANGPRVLGAIYPL